MRRVREESGAVVVIFALLIVALMGVGAIVIDVGAIYQERRELQNGADAAALAIAHDCAVNANCGAEADTAQTYADANAEDGQTTVDSIDLDDQEVTVETSTLASDGDDAIAFGFGKLFGLDGQQVNARATAIWGNPAAAMTVPLALSRCDFNIGTLAGFVPGPPFTGPVQVLVFHTGTATSSGNANSGGSGNSGANANGKKPTTTTTSTTTTTLPPVSQTCPKTRAGQDLPGGFGWLVGDGNCKVALRAGRWADVDTGVNAPAECDPQLLVNRTVLLPVFSEVKTQGSSGEYLVSGFAGFHITGFTMQGGGNRWRVNPPPCSPGASCLGGYFVSFVTSDTLELGGPDFGVTAVKLSE